MDKRMVGTWTKLDTPTWAEYFEKTYFSDGSSCGFISSQPSIDGEGGMHWFRSTWSLKNGRLTSTVVESNDPYLPPGSVFVDQILRLSADKATFRSLESGETSNRYKLPVDRAKSLCHL
jgi:hypothetical protein